MTVWTDEMGMEGRAFATLRAGRMNACAWREEAGGETLKEDFALGTCHMLTQRPAPPRSGAQLRGLSYSPMEYTA